NDESYSKLNLALSDIGEALDTRFKLEDQLIQWSWPAVAPESKK
ncbi:MAG: Rsd/AlgQ family anti-sigma factor, partial [Candidatus Regiella insecticola]|nr:Rsd/AlgQ family anti-sigma factor [Candidatus Regiella insecticola]